MFFEVDKELGGNHLQSDFYQRRVRLQNPKNNHKRGIN
jgi:hypothetical protein